jgi:hypothetical protein
MTEQAGVQFDRAEYESTPGPAECAECQQALAGYYYDVNGQTVCERCRYNIESAHAGGSAAGRLLRAAGAGFVAAILGAALYYVISALSGYEFGLIAIVVGYGVGAAVRWGSNGRGGWVYQTLAIVLTYLAIVSTYIPPIITELSKASETESATTGAQQSSDSAQTLEATPAGTQQEADTEPPPVLFLAAFLLVIAMVAPFLGGFENIIGIIIIGIGLYEAWKLNRRVELTISGPHALASAAVQTIGT